MKHIKTWSERCEEHPDHQHGMISNSMIQARMQEEIDELRQALETEREWVGLTDDEAFKILDNVLGFNTSFGLETNFVRAFARAIEAKLKEKNT